MKRILCIIFVYYDYRIIVKSIDRILDTLPQENIKIVVVENSSPFTDSHIKPYILELINKGKVQEYFLFNKNITNNALELALKKLTKEYTMYDYILLTDGDLYPNNEDWFNEELSIIEKYPNIFAVGVQIDKCNLPVHIFPEAVNWVPPHIASHEDFHEGLTGIWLLLMPVKNLSAFLKHLKKKYLRFLDSNMRYYAYEHANKIWARTFHSVAIHLTYDNYAAKNEYYKERSKKTRQQLWSHRTYSSYWIYNNRGRKLIVPFKSIIYSRYRNIYDLLYKKLWKIYKFIK